MKNDDRILNEFISEVHQRLMEIPGILPTKGKLSKMLLEERKKEKLFFCCLDEKGVTPGVRY